MTAVSKRPQERVLYIDTVRAAMMVLGVFYHSAVIYGGTGWYVSSGDEFLPLRIFYELTQTFRMPVFFIVSGFFAALLLNKLTRRDYVISRLEKIGIPLLFVGFTLNFSIYFLASNRELPESIVEYVLHGHWLGHLWFLGSLIIYVLLLSAIYPAACRLIKYFDRYPVTAILALFCGWSLLIQILRIPADLHQVRWLFVSVGITLQYAPLFLFGFYLFSCKNVQATFFSVRNSILVVVIFLIIFYFLRNTWIRDEVGLWIAIKYLCFYGMSGIVFWAFKILFDRPSSVARKVADASYSIYLLHLPLLIVLFHVIPNHFNPILSFLISSAVTLLISYFLHEKLIRKSQALAYLFNGVRAASGKSRSN